MVRDISDSTNPYKQLPKGNLAGALAGSPTLGTAGGTLRVNDLGIDTAQLAAEAVTEPKLAMGNAPATNQVIGWNGTEMRWVAAGGGGTGDDAYDWATEGNTDLIPTSKTFGRQFYLAATVGLNVNQILLGIPELGDEEPEIGDLIIFQVPASLPAGDITIKVNDAPSRFFVAQDNERVQGADLVAPTKHLITRDTNQYFLLGGETEEWALQGNTDLIPNSKIDGLLAQVMAGTNLTIDRTTSGQITLNATGGGGTGDITGIVTEVEGGLQGGALSGEVTLSLNLVGLGTVGASSLQNDDEFLFYDSSSAAVPNKMMRKDQLVNALVDGTTLDTASGDIQIADEGVAEAEDWTYPTRQPPVMC